jgi:hypothetical protein
MTVIEHIRIMVIADARDLKLALLTRTVAQEDFDLVHDAVVRVLRALMDGHRAYVLDAYVSNQLPHANRNRERHREFAAQTRL